MKRLAFLLVFVLACLVVAGQGIEVMPVSDNYRGLIGEMVKAPIVIRNTDSKPITLTIRREGMQIGSTQKNFLCLDEPCLNQRQDEATVRLEPGQSTKDLYAVLDGGLVAGFSTVRYLVTNRSDPNYKREIDLNFSIEEQPVRTSIYSSRNITIDDVYPNPVSDQAFISYRILNEEVTAKIAVHNILGNVLGEFELSSFETLAKVQTADLSPGIYFYTLYVNNESVLTRKLIVRK